MFTVGINGSPRKTGTTARLMESALKGTGDTGCDTELINLYDLNYKGCVSCLSCKRKGGLFYGSCAIKDDLTKVLEKIKKADVLILGSPIYYGTVTGEMSSFLERLLFPHMDSGPDSSLFQGNLKAGFIYTMGMPRDRFDKYLRQFFEFTSGMMIREFGNLDILYSFDTILTVDDRYINADTRPEHEVEQKNADILTERRKAYEFRGTVGNASDIMSRESFAQDVPVKDLYPLPGAREHSSSASTVPSPCFVTAITGEVGIGKVTSLCAFIVNRIQESGKRAIFSQINVRCDTLLR